MKDALWVLGVLVFGSGIVLAIITVWFAFGIAIRIVAFVIAVFAVLWFGGYVLYSWWTECVVEPYRARKKNRGK